MHLKAVRNRLAFICSILFNMFTITEFVRSKCGHVERDIIVSLRIVIISKFRLRLSGIAVGWT